MLFVLVNCLGGLNMPGNSVCRLTDRVQHYLGCKKDIFQTKSIHIKDLMAKTHVYSAFNVLLQMLV